MNADERLQQIRPLFTELVDTLDIPAPNCACHLNPPCSDCTEHALKRELITQIKVLLTNP